MIAGTNAQQAVWRNGGCASLESATEQQVKRLVASVGSPPLRQAADTLSASFVENVPVIMKRAILRLNI
jgi:carbon monoxide dehydrogenase subunit G